MLNLYQLKRYRKTDNKESIDDMKAQTDFFTSPYNLFYSYLDHEYRVSGCTYIYFNVNTKIKDIDFIEYRILEITQSKYQS